MTRYCAVSRGVLIHFDVNLTRYPRVHTIISPMPWRGKTITGWGNRFTKTQLNTFTTKLGMPRVHYCGNKGFEPYSYYFCADSLYKISEMSDSDHIVDQTQRLKNLKALFEQDPSCKLGKVPDECCDWITVSRICRKGCIWKDGECIGGNFNYDYSALDEINGVAPPPCTVGEQQILEFCPDGKTPKRWKWCLPGGYENREIVEIYRGAVIFKQEVSGYCVIYYTANGAWKKTGHYSLSYLRSVVDKCIESGGWLPAGSVWLEYQQECDGVPPDPDSGQSLVRFIVKADGVGIVGATIKVDGKTLWTDSLGKTFFMADNGKQYTANCTPPAGYECVVCTSTFTAPKSIVGFVLKPEEVVGCNYGDVKPGSTIYCKDGVTWKSRKVCDAYGDWKIDIQNCPDDEEPENGGNFLYPIFDFVEEMLGVDRKTAEMYTYFGIVGVVIVALGAMFGKK